MNPPLDPPSKGMQMIAAYRAARLSQRPQLHASLHQSYLALRRTRAAQRGPGAAPAPHVPVTPADANDPAPQSPAAGSVFAGLVSLAVADRRGDAPVAPIEPTSGQSGVDAPQTDLPETDPAATNPPVTHPAATEPPAMHQAATDPPPPAHPPATDPLAADRTAAQPGHAQPGHAQPGHAKPPPAAAYDPPLAEIGFGPGMLIRLSQLGLHTIGDLAQADASRLRASLGEISRLVDVETWISNARHSTAKG